MFQRPWQDTLRFHAHLFRCFLLAFLDAHTELVFLSRSLAFLHQRLPNTIIDLTHDVHKPVSNRPSPEGRDDDATQRCPPKWRYEATPLPSFTPNVPMAPFVGVVSSFPSHPINVSHGLYHERIPFAAAVWGHARPLSGMVACVLLWTLTLVFLSWRSSTKSGTRSPCRPLRATKSKVPNMDKRRTRYSEKECLSTHDGVERLAADTTKDANSRTSVPEHQVQGAMKTLQKFIPDEIQVPWTVFSQIGTKAWTHILDLAASAYGSNDAIVLERDRKGGRPLVYQVLGLKKGGSRLATFAGNERLQLAANRSTSESSFSTGNVSGSTTAVHNPLHLPSAINDVAVGPISAQDKVCGGTSSWRKIGSVVDATAKVKLNLDTTLSPDGDDIASGSGSAGSGDEVSLGVGTQQVHVSPSERKDGYGTLGEGAASRLGSPLLLRARTTGRKRDRFDDDEGTIHDPYWTEQVYARLSAEFRSRHGWSDPSWLREDESDNWRTQSSQIVAESVGPDDVQSIDSKLRRYSSPCLNVDASPQCTERGNGPSEIYVIPQKRGRATSVQCCPTSSPRLSDLPSDLAFRPCRKTPTLLTPTAWKPGCLYVPDPPEDELRQAAAWWDNLTSADRYETGSTAGHVSVMRDGSVSEQAVLFSRDRPSEGPVSWRDRYENDPASRRFVSVHRRAVTSG